MKQKLNLSINSKNELDVKLDLTKNEGTYFTVIKLTSLDKEIECCLGVDDVKLLISALKYVEDKRYE
jgi:hypothetical protein